MSKRVESKKIAVFELEPDGFSIHTFELSKQLTKSEYRQIKDTLYQGQQGKKNISIYREFKGHYCCKKYQKRGVRIYLEHYESESGFDSYFVRMVINPRVLIEPGCFYLGILPPEESSIGQISGAFEELFEGTDFDNDITSYYLSRLDLCTNIRCDNNRLFRELVRVLRKLPTPPKYERKFYEHKDPKEANRYNKHYLRFCCGTHELVIYDKTYQARNGNMIVDYENLPKGVLRVEVHCERSYIRRIEKDAGISDVLEILWLLVQESEGRIIDHFSRCFTDVKFMQIEDLESKIKKSRFNKKKKIAMLELVKRLQRIQSIDKALGKMKKIGSGTDGLLDCFAQLGISLIPLRKNFCAQSLPGPVELLRSVSKGEVKVEYVKAKYK